MTNEPRRDDVQEDFSDLAENFNRAMMEVAPADVRLDAPAPLQVAFVKYHAALRHNTTWMAEKAVAA